MQSDKSVLQWRCCRRTQQLKAVTHALASSRRVRPSAVVTAFCIHDGDSDTMRHVGGGVLNNPVTRASQSRGGGRIPRAGRLKQVWDNVSDDWLHTEDRRGVERTLILITVRLRFAQTFTTRGLHADN
jgi:hypothetical protein